MKLQKLFVLGFAGLLATLVGCQSHGSMAMAPPSKGVLITTGQGNSVILVPDGSGGTAMLASGKVEKCAACEADVAKYFTGGTLAAKCPVCGSTRTVLTGTN